MQNETNIVKFLFPQRKFTLSCLQRNIDFISFRVVFGLELFFNSDCVLEFVLKLFDYKYYFIFNTKLVYGQRCVKNPKFTFSKFACQIMVKGAKKFCTSFFEVYILVKGAKSTYFSLYSLSPAFMPFILHVILITALPIVSVWFAFISLILNRIIYVLCYILLDLIGIF